MAGILIDSACKIKDEYDKNYPQIYLEKFIYEEKKGKENKKQIKGKLLILDSNKIDQCDESYDESTE